MHSNPTVALLHQHRSERDFTDEALSDADLDAIVEAAWRAPTSINGQQVSVVVVRDTARRARIAELAGGQAWIAKAPVFLCFLIDFNKTAQGVAQQGGEQIIQQSIESWTVGAVDAGIALTSAMTAARALGLGAVAIGGIRRNPQALIELLQLPPLTFPVVGTAIGHINKAASNKPRMPLPAFRHDESYNNAAIAPAIAAYDQTLSAYWQQIGRPDGLPWSANVAARYRSIYYPEVRPAALAQGFTLEK